MKIVIGLDRSPCSRAALDYLRTLSRREGARVIVVSAVRTPVLAYSEVYVPAMGLDEEAMQEQMRASQELVSEAEKKLRLAGLTTEARVIRGDPGEAIVKVARTEGADLVVVGSHGRTGIAKLFLGSVASHVVTHAPCSVLVVKADLSDPKNSEDRGHLN